MTPFFYVCALVRRRDEMKMNTDKDTGYYNTKV